MTDHLGGTTRVLTESGALLSELRYSAWGETRYSYGATPTNKQYTGQNLAEIGMYFYQARFYDPLLGRFLSPDTFIPDPGHPLAWDRYMGTYGNPSRMIDPSGHSPCDVAGADPECEGLSIGKQNLIEQPEEPTLPLPGDILSTTIIVIDGVSFVISGVEAVVADVVGGAIITTGCGATALETAGVGCGAFIGLALSVDAAIASYGSPIGAIENVLGWASTGLTWLADQDNVWTTDGSYVSVGQDTVISLRNTLMGQIPESNIDALISFSQLKYDLIRAEGVDPGGRVFIYDSVSGVNPNLGSDLWNILLGKW